MNKEGEKDPTISVNIDHPENFNRNQEFKDFGWRQDKDGLWAMEADQFVIKVETYRQKLLVERSVLKPEDRRK